MDNKRGKSSDANIWTFIVLLLILLAAPVVLADFGRWSEILNSITDITGMVTGQTNVTVTIGNSAATLSSATVNQTNTTMFYHNEINASVTADDTADGGKVNITAIIFVNQTARQSQTLDNVPASPVSTPSFVFTFSDGLIGGDNITVQFNATNDGSATNYVNSTPINVNNTAPTIGNITFNADSNPVTVTENGFETLTFYFLASDPDGQLINNSARANITNANSTYISTNNSCINLSSPGPKTTNYSCTVDVWYFNLPGTWNVTVQVNDSHPFHTSISRSQNTTWNFTIQDTTAIAAISSISFPTVSLGATNTTSTEDIRINNTGNHNTTGTTGSTIDVTGYNLRGTPDQLYNITVGNFTISNNTGGVECGFATANRTISNGTQIVIANGTLSPGNRSIAGQGNETLYVCLPQAPAADLLAQDYVANGSSTWIITVN